MQVHHVGYLVKKLQKAQKVFESLGYTLIQEALYDEYRKVDIAFLEKDGVVVELVSPAAEDSVVSGLIKQYRNSPYHICYTSQSFDEEVSQLCSQGFVQMGEACPAPAIDGKRVVFLMNAAIGIIEVLEA